MRIVWLGILCVVLLSCREYHSFNAPVPILGYQINGKVTSTNGVALDNVSVKVFYTYVRTSTFPVDTANYYVTDTTKRLQINVYDAKERFVRTLFSGFPSSGPLPRYFFDAIGDTFPSGKYFIKYLYDTSFVRTIPVLIDGKITATSNYKGEFILEHESLPVGEQFDIFDNSRRYEGTFRVKENVELFLQKGTKQGSYSIVVQKDFITKRTFTIE
ncbi:MAG: hypothetical protein HY960_10205 [Ignavibacteriae bacterium]|nr:hypothetical protein [Ignavibacteriota bacterium]